MGVTSVLLSLAALSLGVRAAPVAEPFVVDYDDSAANLTLTKRATAVNYVQNYVASGASVTFSPNQGAGSFGINYNTNADFVVGLGWNPGDKNPITIGGSFSASRGVGLVSIYGWSTNPLVEYYIMETSTGYSKAGTQKGTLTSDGGTYEIWEHQQVNQPSISGTTTFQQYISIRTSPRTSGTVTVANHFNAWAAAGMNLGTLNYQTLSVESWSGAGSGTMTVSKGAAAAAAPASPAAPATSSAPAASTGGSGTTAPATGSGTVAKWGQCGGQGWTGATSCAAGSTCKAANSYYSQCL